VPFLTVVSVTFSGGEEIGIYTSLFTTNNELIDIIMLVSVIIVFTGFWCGLAYYFINRSFLAERFRHITGRLLPFCINRTWNIFYGGGFFLVKKLRKINLAYTA